MLIYTQTPITNSIAIQPEINYTTKGSEQIYDNGVHNMNIKIQYQLY
jgi:hypothetical protein